MSIDSGSPEQGPLAHCMNEGVTSRYELMYIIPTTFTDEEAGTIETRLNGLLTKLGANVEATRRLGKLRFAYPINKQRHGYYVLVTFVAEPSALGKIEENLRIQNDILRHMTIKLDDAGEQKFDLVQFTEVNVDAKDDRARRRSAESKEGATSSEEKKEEMKSAVAAIEEGEKDAETKEDVAGSSMSTDELEKKIESALSEEV